MCPQPQYSGLRHEDWEFARTSRVNLRPCFQKQNKKGEKQNKKEARKKTKCTVLMNI